MSELSKTAEHLRNLTALLALRNRSTQTLNAIGSLYGIKRRWFGFEPDIFYRRRVMNYISTGEQ
jgi:hypothetical protein